MRASYDQKPYRRTMIETFGGVVHPSPSDLTNAGRTILEQDPDSTGSLGIAISEAVEMAAGDPTTNYALGSVLNHVLMHQTVIGEEALLQLASVGETPDLLVGCTGGGSNFAGLSFPFLREKWAGRMSPTVRAVEPASCPSLTQGIVPAPEPTHAIAAAILEANRCKESGEEKTILTALCGHGHLDIAAYESYLHGTMSDLDFPEDELRAAMEAVPVV